MQPPPLFVDQIIVEYILSICVRGSCVVERRAAPLIQVVDAGSRTHQSEQTLVVTVGGSIVQRSPGKTHKAQFIFDQEQKDQCLDLACLTMVQTCQSCPFY